MTKIGSSLVANMNFFKSHQGTELVNQSTNMNTNQDISIGAANVNNGFWESLLIFKETTLAEKSQNVLRALIFCIAQSK